MSILDRLEQTDPSTEVSQERSLLSIAISLKRLADVNAPKSTINTERMAFELGYKAHEKGQNIQMALSEFDELMAAPK